MFCFLLHLPCLAPSSWKVYIMNKLRRKGENIGRQVFDSTQRLFKLPLYLYTVCRLCGLQQEVVSSLELQLNPDDCWPGIFWGTTHWRCLTTRFTSSLVVLRMGLCQRIYSGGNPGQSYCVNDGNLLNLGYKR